MLFNSYIFIFVFLPVTITGFWTLSRIVGRNAAIIWLVACSLVFYGYWNPAYVSLILGSMIFNFTIGYIIGRAKTSARIRKAWAALGISGNLALLGYFKYANFFVDSSNALFNTEFTLQPIVLPLAISFFTFQQIAYIADAYKGLTHEYSFRDYALFVTFFPQLIAGPIVHHKQMMPQFANKSAKLFSYADFAAGLTLFSLGLCKKVLIADSMARYANPAYNVLLAGGEISTADAWTGATAYTFQLYFDFSGYSDMAMGLALLFGIRLPLNFNSPYKARNTGEFWRRWHITLSNFLRDYLYVPLGGNRQGAPRHYRNLMVTMALSGIWHGAGWTFVLWGFQQGLFHWIFQAWTSLKNRLHITIDTPTTRAVAIAITFFSWVIGLVLFRAPNLDVALQMYKAMFFLQGIDADSVIRADRAVIRIVLCALIVWTCPNTVQIMARIRPVVDWARVESQLTPAFSALRRIVWRPNLLTATGAAVLAFYTVLYIGRRTSEFLYFQF